MRDVALVYEHECNPPPVNVSRPERTKWYCPDCGTGWLFARRQMDGHTVARWFPALKPNPCPTCGRHD